MNLLLQLIYSHNISQYLLLIKINKNFRNFRLTDSNIFDIYTFVYYILYVTIYFILATILQYCNKIDKNKYFRRQKLIDQYSKKSNQSKFQTKILPNILSNFNTIKKFAQIPKILFLLKHNISIEIARKESECRSNGRINER